MFLGCLLGVVFSLEAGGVPFFESDDEDPVELLSFADVRVEDVDAWRDELGGIRALAQLGERGCEGSGPVDEVGELGEGLVDVTGRVRVGPLDQGEDFVLQRCQGGVVAGAGDGLVDEVDDGRVVAGPVPSRARRAGPVEFLVDLASAPLVATEDSDGGLWLTLGDLHGRASYESGFLHGVGEVSQGGYAVLVPGLGRV